MKKKLSSIAALLGALAPALLSGSCSGSDKAWSLSGNIAGLDGATSLAIEALGATGRWYVVDSLTTDASGNYSYTAATAAPYPEIMRFTLPGAGSIYFPVDSVDRITIDASAADFAVNHRIGGSAAARNVNDIDSIIRVADADDETGRMNLKRQLADFITSDSTALIAYYVINKSVADKPIFDPTDAFDNRVYGAAAQAFANYRPNDARGKALLQAYIEGRRALGKHGEPQTRTIEVEAQGLIDIDRYDNRGERHSLAEVAAKGKPVVLSFTSYDLDSSPAYNIVLSELYNKYHDRGLEIYQLAFNPDELQWKEVARNLPWITVWNSPTDGSAVVASYNVNMLPLTYIIGSDGVIAERVENPDRLAAALAKHF